MCSNTTNNGKITIDGYEIDMSIRSHPVDEKILREVKRIYMAAPNKRLGAAIFNLHRNNLRVIIENGTCSPETLVKFLSAIRNNKKAE